MATNVKVLLVDDNPVVLGMLQKMLAPVSRLTTATDGADALLKAIDDPPDLLISDYAMPVMDGRQLVEKLRGRQATARTAVILMASKQDIGEKLKPMQDAVEDFLEKPFFLKDARVRLKRVIDKIALEKMAREAQGSTILRGSLAQMNVIDLLQSLEMGRKSCALQLTNGRERCEMFFQDGQIVHAQFGAMRGDEAVYPVLAWADGNFQINFEGRTQEQTTTRTTQGLLMEGLRLLDEANRDAEENVLEGLE